MPVSKKDRQALKFQLVAAVAAAAAEDAAWEDMDTKASAKKRRQEQRIEAHDAKVAARRDRRVSEQLESEALSITKKAQRPQKITQAEVARRQALLAAANMQKPKLAAVKPPKVEENKNRLHSVVEASGIDAAISALSVAGGGGGGGAISFKEFEKQTLQQLKEENPCLKTSQYREHVRKLWARSSQNPQRR